MLERHPHFRLRFVGRLLFTRFGRKAMRTMAVEPQKRRYPEDWVAVYVEGDGEDYDLGIDYLEFRDVESIWFGPVAYHDHR